MSEQCTQCGSPLNTAGGCMTCTDHLMNTLVVDMFGSPEQKKDVELATLKSRNAELEAELERERCSNITALADAEKLYEERWKVVEMLAGELASMKNQYHNEETTGSRETQMAEAWAETQVKEGKK